MFIYLHIFYCNIYYFRPEDTKLPQPYKKVIDFHYPYHVCFNIFFTILIYTHNSITCSVFRLISALEKRN